MDSFATRPASPTANVFAEEVLSALDQQIQIAPLSARYTGFDLAKAYRVAAAVHRMRKARGERAVGRKIGFTNHTIWDEFGVDAPIWSHVYDRTLYRLSDLGGGFELSTMIEPRIEPEIIFGLARSPEPDMDERTLLSCVEWIAHGFEIVQSIYPGWRFQTADTVAAFGLHGALLVGPAEPIRATNAASWLERLAQFGITLLRDGVTADQGHAANVLGGGPLSALHHLLEVLADDPTSPSLVAGEIISTGTLTRALPIAPGERWTTTLSGLALPGISLTLA